MSEFIHPNGYTAILYGKSSMSIRYMGKEVLHTGHRTVNTPEEVCECLEGMPDFMDALRKKNSNVTSLLEEVAEDICDNFCKYRDTCDDNCECEHIRKGNTCPLDRL